MTPLTLYCNSFQGLEPYHTQQNQKTLMCGARALSEEVRSFCVDKGYILDDTGDNISHLNYLLGDLTGTYWVWKNATEEFVGTNQYCRFYNDRDLEKILPLQSNTLYVTNFLDLHEPIWSQYKKWHTDLGIKLLEKAVDMDAIAIPKDHLSVLYNKTHLSHCNAFFGHRLVFHKVCQVLFEILFELYQGSKYIIEFVQQDVHVGRSPNEKRLLAFLAERILNIIYFNSHYYLGTINIVPVEFYRIK